jgi:acetylglutamate kinase
MTKKSETDGLHEAEILAHALPYMQRYTGRTVVVKYGGNAMGDETLGKAFCRDIALLKQAGVHPVVVHGGGPQIGSMLERMNIKSEFKDGLRVTDQDTIEIVEMVLAGSINKSIVASINAEGARAVGLCGKDGNMVLVEKLRRTSVDPNSNIERIVDLGFVGEPKEVDSTVLDLVIEAGLIPVVAPVCFGKDGKTYNVNADTFAGALASALDAKRLLFLTDVEGVLDNDKKLIKELTIKDAKALIKDGTINGGMIPKVETCISALGDEDEGVEGVVIVNGKKPHAVLLEIFTEHGAGTLIKP